MRRRNFFSKTTACILAIGISVALLGGCQNKSNDNGNAQVANSSAQSNSSKNSNKQSAEQMKKRIQDSIQSLVTAGTITQDQADKIVTAYTTRPAGEGKKEKTKDKQDNNQQGNTQQGNSQNNGQNKQRFNPLNKLVSDGTITQAQADAVTQKIRENSKRNNGGQGSQNSNNQSSN